MCCTRLAENTGRKKIAKNCHLCTITQLCRAISSQLRHVSTLGKKLVKQQYLLHMPHNMVNFSPLTAEIGSLVWSSPVNFTRFRILASLLHQCRATEVNQTLHTVWPSLGLVHYIYIYTLAVALAPQRNFDRCKIHFASKSCVLLYWQHHCTALEQWASAKLCGVQQRAPPIFGRVAITLGIGPHSSYLCCRWCRCLSLQL